MKKMRLILSIIIFNLILTNTISLDSNEQIENLDKNLLKFSKTKVIALDRDQSVINISNNLKKKYPKRFFFYHCKMRKQTDHQFYSAHPLPNIAVI